MITFLCKCSGLRVVLRGVICKGHMSLFCSHYCGQVVQKYKQGGQFLKKLWCCVGGDARHNSLIHSDERLTLETSAFNLFTVANLPHQLS